MRHIQQMQTGNFSNMLLHCYAFLDSSASLDFLVQWLVLFYEFICVFQLLLNSLFYCVFLKV